MAVGVVGSVGGHGVVGPSGVASVHHVVSHVPAVPILVPLTVFRIPRTSLILSRFLILIIKHVKRHLIPSAAVKITRHGHSVLLTVHVIRPVIEIIVHAVIEVSVEGILVIEVVEHWVVMRGERGFFFVQSELRAK